MVREEFGEYLDASRTIWIEPSWKMLLSNKGILPVLWEMYPGHPNLLEARFGSPGGMQSWVRKPLLGREGANITLHSPGAEVETEGEYGEEGFVYQATASLALFQEKFATLGSWVIGQGDGATAAGIGIRESESPIITNTSHFVPHLFQ